MTFAPRGAKPAMRRAGAAERADGTPHAQPSLFGGELAITKQHVQRKLLS